MSSPRAGRGKQRSQGIAFEAPVQVWQPVPWDVLEADVLALYNKSAKKTTAKMRQVLREFRELENPKTKKPAIVTTADLRPGVIAWWKEDDLYAHRKPATIDSLLRSLNSAITIGLASGYLLRNPLDLAIIWPDVDDSDDEEEPAPRTPHHPAADVCKVLSYLEGQRLKSWQDHRLFAMAALFALTGVRKMEGLTLQFRDLDFDTNCILIPARRAITSRRTGKRIRKQKTKASAAPVGMPLELVDILRGWLHEANRPPRGENKECWLFPQVSGAAPWTQGCAGQRPLDRLKGRSRRTAWSSSTCRTWGRRFMTVSLGRGRRNRLATRVDRYA